MEFRIVLPIALESAAETEDRK